MSSLPTPIVPNDDEAGDGSQSSLQTGFPVDSGASDCAKEKKEEAISLEWAHDFFKGMKGNYFIFISVPYISCPFIL